jgi:hypothetical protein
MDFWELKILVIIYWNQVSAMQRSGHVVQSQAIRVEVYKAPRIHPHEIFLVPGASYMVCPKVQVLFLQY